jgi:methionyl-tRNA formyltransferase
MKKIFVVTDNKKIFEELKKIITSKENIAVDYFCSHKSQAIFKNEINANKIIPVTIKENTDFFIENYDLGISCHSKQLFPSKLVKTILCINIHPGLNPYNRGWFPQVFSIINGLPVGATIHVMDEEIDHGDIIIQEEVKIYSFENSLDVYNKVHAKEIELFSQVVDNILARDFPRIKPKFEGNYNSIDDYKKLCQIDLNKKVTMKQAIDFLRAMTHPPYKNAYFLDENGNKVYISVQLELSEESLKNS